MAQEVGESLIYSWLRHVKGCQVVQINWKLSPSWNMNNNYAMAAQKVYNCLFHHVNAKFNQALCQTECDVFGVSKKSKTGLAKIYVVEVAFHRDGLHYNKYNSNNSLTKVIQKLIRTAFCVYSTFGNVNAEIIFATPKTSVALKNQIGIKIDALNRFAKRHKIRYTFRLICNDDFKYRIIDPVFIMSKGVYDNSELFMRSIQLLELFGLNNIKRNLNNPMSFEEFGKVTDIANIALRACLRNLRITPISIGPLMGLTNGFHPIVRTVPPGLSSRYYVAPVKTKSGDHYLCNHWLNSRKTNLINFVISNI